VTGVRGAAGGQDREQLPCVRLGHSLGKKALKAASGSVGSPGSRSRRARPRRPHPRNRGIWLPSATRCNLS
jgi:hypothetical protein